jgi:hypothetical protein
MVLAADAAPPRALTEAVDTAASEDGVRSRASLRSFLLRAGRPVAIFAASRVAVLVAMWLELRLRPGTPGAQPFLAWDSGLYFQIIRDGYSSSPADPGIYAFFPAFPLSSRLLTQLPGIGALDAGLIVGLVASFAAAIAIWMLTAELKGRDTADRTLALFAFFPGSFVLSMLYSEGLMLALSAACLWALGRRKWLLAGVLAALATASRPNAIALVAACAWAAGAAILSRREWRSLIAPALSPLGLVAFFGLLWQRTGDPLKWFHVESRLWHEHVTPLAIVHWFQDFVALPFVNTNTLAACVGALVCAVGLVLVFRSKLPGPMVVYTVVIVAMAACSATLGPRPRFVLTAFPLFIAFALRLRGVAFSAVLGLSALLLGAFTMISLATILFTP